MSEMLINSIPTLGFPICCVIGLGIFIYKFWQYTIESNEKRESVLIEQNKEFTKSLDKFNDTLIQIDLRLQAIEKQLDKE